MNLNILIKKIKSTFLLQAILFGCVSSAQQNLISWEVADPQLNRKFIEMYLNKLIENDKFEQNSIQASDVIIVQMQQQDDKITLKRLRAKNYDSGEYRKFMMDQVKKLGPDIMNTLMDRKYKWAEINRRDLSALETYSNIDNILNERSFKRARDGFWWTTSQVEVSSNESVYIRSKSTNQAFRLETGLSDLGLYRQFFGNTILGLSNDISSTYLIVPREVDVKEGDDIKQPLDGTFGIGFKFDTHSIGGQVNYMDAGNKFKTGRVHDEEHVVLPSASGLIYWSNTFAINNFIDLSKVKFLEKLTKNISGAQRTDEAFGSLRLKVGLTFTEFIHAKLKDGTSDTKEGRGLEIIDRLNKVDEALGFFVRSELVTDNKKIKAYAQANQSFNGFNNFSLGAEYSIKVMKFGFQIVKIPKDSGLEFLESNSNNSSTWQWYPAGKPGGQIVQPYISFYF
mgnify:FL=1